MKFVIISYHIILYHIVGYDIGATSSVLSQLKSSKYAGVSMQSEIIKSSFLQGSIASLVTLGAVIGSVICYYIADDIGRKRSLQLAAVLYIVGAILESFSGIRNWAFGSIAILLLGRFVYGIGSNNDDNNCHQRIELINHIYKKIILEWIFIFDTV